MLVSYRCKHLSYHTPYASSKIQSLGKLWDQSGINHLFMYGCMIIMQMHEIITLQQIMLFRAIRCHFLISASRRLHLQLNCYLMHINATRLHNTLHMGIGLAFCSKIDHLSKTSNLSWKDCGTHLSMLGIEYSLQCLYGQAECFMMS